MVGHQERHQENEIEESTDQDLELVPNHTIFISHSGAQKSFVDHLCEALEKAGHYPFFDLRTESLPEGERFADLIFQAARQCHVAVVVLSKEYLRSKWPMLELVTFVEAQRSSNPKLKILPLFYKVGVNDIKGENEALMTVWRGLAVEDARLDPTKCLNAVRVLASINGKVFGGESEVEYKEVIVASICEIIGPVVQFDVSAMEGRERLCQIVGLRFEQLGREQCNPLCSSKVGVYGMGGMGKTLLCKALCNVFYSKFSGRVLHVELQGSKESSKKDNIIHVQKLVLETLTNAKTPLLNRIRSVDEGNAVVKKRLPRKDVFLAIDNVPERSLECGLEWVRTILKHLSPESKAVVTSRCMEYIEEVVLYDLNSSTSPCMRRCISFIQVPTLEKDEALEIFLRHAFAPIRPLSSFEATEMEILEACMERCFFPNKDQPAVRADVGHISGHYHPLALQALGSYLKGINKKGPLEWINESKVLQESGNRHYLSVFDILRAGYDALPSPKDKLVFLDIALFAPRRKLNNVYCLCDWLGAIHGMDQEETLNRVKRIQKSSLIEDWEKNKMLKVTIHDLYAEFAEHQIGLEESRGWCVYEKGGDWLPLQLQQGPSGVRWSNLMRLRLKSTKLKSMLPLAKIREWSSLVVLDINLFWLKSFDIGPLKCLRRLKLKSSILETLTWHDNRMEQLRCVSLSCKRFVRGPDFSNSCNLLDFNMRFIDCPWSPLTRLDPLRTLLSRNAGAMKLLQLVGWNEKFPEVLDVRNLPNLETVVIVGDFNLSRSNKFVLKSRFSVKSLGDLAQLTRLVLTNLPIRGSLLGLAKLISLRYLMVGKCVYLNELPGLGGLTNLEVLDASSTAIEELSGVENLLKLRELYLVNCTRLKTLPSLESLASLVEVFTQGCSSLSKQPRVSGSCTLVSVNICLVVHQWERFLSSLYTWTRCLSNRYKFATCFYQRSNFQSVLGTCPTPESYWHAPAELEELRKAFETAYRAMHDMADKGRRKQAFDPETDLVICSELVSVIDKYSWQPDIRGLGKSSRFLEITDQLRRRLLRAVEKRNEFTLTDPAEDAALASALEEALQYLKHHPQWWTNQLVSKMMCRDMSWDTPPTEHYEETVEDGHPPASLCLESTRGYNFGGRACLRPHTFLILWPWLTKCCTSGL